MRKIDQTKKSNPDKIQPKDTDTDNFMEDFEWITKKMHCILEPDSNLGGLYLGDYDGARDFEELAKLKIKAVLTCAAALSVSYPKDIVDEHCIIKIYDTINCNIKDHFEKCIEFIDKNRKKTSVYVHCAAGVSRSATMVIVYLMAKMNMRYTDALDFVRKKRKVVCPNSGFTKQLIEYDKELFEKKDKKSKN